MTESDRGVSLRSRLEYEPVELKFGTSGRRGDVVHLTQLEVYINALAEIEYLQSLPLADGGVARGDSFYIAYDLRPSSSRYVESQAGRGEIAQAIVRAVRDAGMQPVNQGRIPTPALTCYALGRSKGSIMVTGSHIPFSRNGYKLNTSRGELRKRDERPIGDRVREVRRRLYDEPYGESLFDAQGLFKEGHQELPPEAPDALNAYIGRYTEFFRGRSLRGMRLLCYQHSAVGRDILAEILGRLDAEVVAEGRSETFVPIDTENIDDPQLAAIQSMADAARAESGRFDAVVSTDGDSDRPLLLGVDPETGSVRFFGGDLLGMITAEFLGAGAVVVPISCNDAIDRGPLREILEPRTRIGSPYVIEGMEKARGKGKNAVCGWEANGGFLTGTDIEQDGHVLPALPTRDAVLPLLCTLFAAQTGNLNKLFARLPARFSRASLLKDFPRSRGAEILRRFSPPEAGTTEVRLDNGRLLFFDSDGGNIPADAAGLEELNAIRSRLEKILAPDMRCAGLVRLNYADGLRMIFSTGEVVHVRPSGNADELRIYAVADSQGRADEIARAGVAEPDGILRRLEKELNRE